MSAGRADRVAYTAPPIRTAWSASDVAPLPNSFFFSVLRFVSSSLSSIRPPVRIGLRRRPCATRPGWTTRGSHGEFRGANPHAGRTTPGRATRLDGTPSRRVANEGDLGRGYRLEMSPLVRAPETPKPSDGMKTWKKSLPLPAGPLSHTVMV